MAQGKRDYSRKPILLVSICFSLSCLLAGPGARELHQKPENKSGSSIDLQTILDKMAAHRRMKAKNLAIYEVERK